MSLGKPVFVLPSVVQCLTPTIRATVNDEDEVANIKRELVKKRTYRKQIVSRASTIYVCDELGTMKMIEEK